MNTTPQSMGSQTTDPGAPPRHLLRSTGAVLLGFFAVMLLSLATDQVLHMLKIYPPWGEPMRDPALNLLALAYRSVFAVAGSYLAARFAPRNPMRHALVLGTIGLILSTAGAVAAMSADLGPRWFPIALVITALPCAWMGGVMYRRQAERRARR